MFFIFVTTELVSFISQATWSVNISDPFPPMTGNPHAFICQMLLVSNYNLIFVNMGL